MATLAIYAIVLTAAVYIPAFAFFGDTFGPSCDDGRGVECIQFDFSDCGLTCIDDFLSTILNALLFFFNLITLGGIDGDAGNPNPIDPLLRFAILAILGVMWTLIIVGQFRGAAQG